MCDKAAAEGDYRKVEKIARISSVGNKVVLALLVALGFYFGSSAIEAFVNWVPEWGISWYGCCGWYSSGFRYCYVG